MARPTSERGSRPSVFGWAWRGTKFVAKAPFSTFPAAAITGNVRLIRRLYEQVRHNWLGGRDPGVYRTEDGRIDLPATAFTLGLDATSLEQRIGLQRRQTARVAYSSFGLGCVFVVLWVGQGLTPGLSGAHLVGALEFTPFVAIFFLVAFKNAHVNWQLRTGQLGSATDYLRSPEPFLPR